MVSILQPSDELAELVDFDAEFREIGSGFVFTEGPAWDTRRNCLVFSDIPGDARWRWSAADGLELVARPNYMGNGMVYEPDGSLLVCEQVTSSIVRIKPNGDRQVVAFHYRGNYLNSPNDVVTRSDGSVYFTDPSYGRGPIRFGVERACELSFRGVYRVPPGGGDAELVVAEDEFKQPNGLCFSPDESILYVDDLQELKSFVVEADGSLSRPTVLQDSMGSGRHPGTGNPDGMKCDVRGNIWCTARDGIWVIAPDGRILGIIETPEVSANLVWGGSDWKSLYVTTTTTVQVLETTVASAPLPYHGPQGSPSEKG